MKDCWDLLNIPPDSDKETVKKAYARLAKFYHPEEHPREFVMLQKAFKEALKCVPEKRPAPDVKTQEDQPEQLKKIFEAVNICEAEQPEEVLKPIDKEGAGRSLFKEESVPEYHFYLEKREEMLARMRHAVTGKDSICRLEELLDDLYFCAMLQDREFHREADTILSAYIFTCRTKRVKGVLLQAKRLGLYSFTLSILRCLKIRRAIPAVIVLVIWILMMAGVFLSRDPQAYNQKEYKRMQEESAMQEQMREIAEENKREAPVGSMESAQWMQMLMTGELHLEGEEGDQTLKSGYPAETGEAGTVYAEGIREIRYTFTEVIVLKLDDGWKIFDSRNRQMYDTDYMDILVVQVEDSAMKKQGTNDAVIRKLAVTRDNERWYLADLLGKIETEISGEPQCTDNAVNAYDNIIKIEDGIAAFSE
ncbi:J domain-containing protein [Lachnospiraceae bacterium 50-23]|jgi:hypothetical protein|nr:DnaJ domain-containing protein [Dorea sp.]